MKPTKALLSMGRLGSCFENERSVLHSKISSRCSEIGKEGKDRFFSALSNPELFGCFFLVYEMV